MAGVQNCLFSSAWLTSLSLLHWERHHGFMHHTLKRKPIWLRQVKITKRRGLLPCLIPCSPWPSMNTVNGERAQEKLSSDWPLGSDDVTTETAVGPQTNQRLKRMPWRQWSEAGRNVEKNLQWKPHRGQRARAALPEDLSSSCSTHVK